MRKNTALATAALLSACQDESRFPDGPLATEPLACVETGAGTYRLERLASLAWGEHLAVDDRGDPHAVFLEFDGMDGDGADWSGTEPHLHYARRVGAGWTTEALPIADPPPRIESLVVTADGAAHIVLSDPDLTDLTNQGGRWHRTPIASRSPSAGDGDLVRVEVRGDAVHVGYSDGCRVGYATDGGGAWVNEEVSGSAPSPDGSCEWTFAVDPEGRPTFLGRPRAGEPLAMSVRFEQGWVVTPLGDLGGLNIGTAELFFDRYGREHLLFGSNVEHMVHARRGWVGWTSDWTPDFPEPLQIGAMWLGPEGDVRLGLEPIGLDRTEPHRVFLGRPDEGDWSLSRIATVGRPWGWTNHFAFDRAGELHALLTGPPLQGGPAIPDLLYAGPADCTEEVF